MRHLLLRSCVISLLVPGVLWAGKITLKDGTVYEGTVKKYGSTYSIKLADGTSKIVLESNVKSVDDGTLTGPAAGTTGGTAGGGGTNPANGGGTAGTNGSLEFQAAYRKAERCDSPLEAVTLWTGFIDKHTGADAEAGKKELARWQTMAKEGAEKVNGKWLVGDDLEKLHKDVDGKIAKAIEQIRGDQAVLGVKGLEDVLKIYPNSFIANFEMGYFNLRKITQLQGSNDLINKSIKSLEAARKLKPDSPATLTNLAIAYNFGRRYEESVMVAYQAAQREDSKEIVQNLANAINHAPPMMRKNNPRVLAILPDAGLLISKHGASPDASWTYVRPGEDDQREGSDKGPGAVARKGFLGSGTGFFISDDGYIMTNRHVAAAGNKMVVRFSDGTQRVAEKVVVDDDQDIAILKITEPKDKLPFIRLATYDEPNVGTDVTVMGFPLGAMMGMNVKITRGVVTSIEDGKRECDVIVDAQVNPGNSGGPMLDKHGNLLALVAMKTLSDEKISSYGLGISTGRLRKFFDHQKDKLTGVKLTAADKTDPAGPSLSTEDIAQKFTKATVMILIYAGDAGDLGEITK